MRLDLKAIVGGSGEGKNEGSESLQPFEIMDRFSGLPSGNFLLSLDHDEMDSEADTLLESDSEAETIPGEPVEVISLSSSESSSELELVEVIDVENDHVSQFWSPEQENERMRGQERYGHFHRVEAQQSAIQARLRRISEAIASESPADRQVRRRRFHEAVHGVMLW